MKQNIQELDTKGVAIQKRVIMHHNFNDSTNPLESKVSCLPDMDFTLRNHSNLHLIS